MKGLAIWAYSNCRSTLSFELELARLFDVPYKIFIVHKSDMPNRVKVGFKRDEIIDSSIVFIEDDLKKAIEEFKICKDWNHLFASYQKQDIFKSLINLAIENKSVYAIISEAPCNMEATMPRRTLKELYINLLLPRIVSKYVRHADFIINLSGYYESALAKLGWKNNKIISCGYYPPPIPDSTLRKRTEDNWNNFTILLSGLHQWHRGSIVLLQALRILNEDGVKCQCYITQDGPMMARLKQYADKHKLDNVHFLGYVPMEKLISLYETCSVYVGAGCAEPWGMRLNDVLQCGAPLIVSRGMGGAKLVDDHGCGLTFGKNNYKELADAIKTMIEDKSEYMRYSKNAYIAAQSVTPALKAKEIGQVIKSQFGENWKRCDKNI